MIDFAATLLLLSLLGSLVVLVRQRALKRIPVKARFTSRYWR